MLGLGVFATRKVEDAEDYIVAGRRLTIFLAWSTILATWFGAGTVLTVCTEVSKQGLERAGLDPLGSGLCLIIAGLFFAKPLWEMKLLTMSDFFRRRFGPRMEVVSALVMIPSYFGWIAAQFVALAQVFALFFDLPVNTGVLLIAVFGTGYTLLGGMWAVTLTDAVQITLVLIGLVILTFNVLTGVGHGNPNDGFWNVMHEIEKTAPTKLQWIPMESPTRFWDWVSILCAGALGNIPGQDLLQRIFASKSSDTAKKACILAGIAYIVFGLLPVLLGLVAAAYYKDRIQESVLPALANAFLHPVMAVIFVVVITSAVLATITSAILSPATVLAQNLLTKLPFIKISSLTLNRICVVFIATCSVIMAFSGQGAFALLENAYSITMVGLFVPLTMGLYTRPRNELPALASTLVGIGVWIPQYVLGWQHFLEGVPPFDSIGLSLSLTATMLSFITYLAIHLWQVKMLKEERLLDDVRSIEEGRENGSDT
ncbi:MAG: sodium:solute symporter family protein [Cyanobacteria bacterium]|nr:sodium:solute symporter family protein [Cyanobacteriota bacterium]